MKEKCLTIFEKLEKKRLDIFSELDTLSDEQLHFKIHPEKWNILQVGFHLMTAEKLSVIYMKRKTHSEEELQKAGFKSWLRLVTLKIAFHLPFKYTAPKQTDATGKDPDYENLKSDWEKVRTQLKSLIENLDETTLKSEILKHPRVGMINMKQTLEFMELHLEHHQKQIDGIIGHSSFPE